MTQTVHVVEVDENGLCTVEFSRESACGGNCASCGNCSSNNMIKAKAFNTAGAEAGDLVVVESKSKDIYGIAVLIYLIPVLLLLLGYIVADYLFENSYAPGVGAVTGFVLGMAGSVIYARKRRERVYLTVTHILRKLP